MSYYHTLALAAWAILCFPKIQAFALSNNTECRCMPGDACWPSLSEWSSLNETVNGRLIATVPLATPCHDPHYDEAECAYLQENWGLPEVHFNSSSSIMLPIFQNQTCDPFTGETTPCELGNLVDYSIDVRSKEDAIAGLKFAQEKNIRLVVKNTGHDFLGKSTGKGALGLWTHHLKSIEILDNYESQGYSGPAVKMGAGVQAWEAFEAADKAGYVAIGGDCTTVGIAGGFSMGAGHGTMSSKYGLAADQTLEWEVVTANGTYLIASPTQNTDLYWALSGGGPGSWGVVLSLTAKVYPDGPVGGASLVFSSSGISTDLFWDLIAFWQEQLPTMVDTGAQIVSIITSESFSLQPLTAPNMTKDEVLALLEPFTAELSRWNVSYSLNATESSGFLPHFNTFLGPLPYGQYGTAEVVGGRLIPRSLVTSNNAELITAMRAIADAGFLMNALGLNVGHSIAGNTAESNAVLPAWRETIFHLVVAATWNYTAPFEENAAKQDEITNDLVPQLEALTPGFGTYMNEGDFQLKTWKSDYYGSNYDRLLEVKNKYDVNDIFYGTTAVGSDAWVVEVDGRLCRA